MTAFDKAWKMVKAIPHEIPPLRQLQDESQRFRDTAGSSPKYVKRNEGGTSVSSKKGDKRDMKSSSEKIIDARLNRLGLGGQRGEGKGNSH